MGLSKQPSITIEELYELVHPYNIFKYFCSNWGTVNYELNTNFISDEYLRPGDKHPSARITMSSSNVLYYIDYGENIPRGAVNFVKDIYNFDTLERAINLIFNTLYNINKTKKKLNLTNNKTIKKVLKQNVRKDVKINIKSKAWNKKNLHYWEQYGWTLELLNEAKIKPVSKIWINGRKISNTSFAFCIDYYWHKGIFRRKIYFPNQPNAKFIANINSTVVQGWDLLPKTGGDTLIITKAFKEIGTFKSIDVYSCATNNETSFLPDSVIIKLKSRWKNIIIWWDFDREGIESGLYFANKYDLKFVCNPVNTAKDPSDYYKKYGKDEFKKLYNKLINT